MYGRSIFSHTKVTKEAAEVKPCKNNSKKPLSIFFEYGGGNYLQEPTRLRAYYEDNGKTMVLVPTKRITLKAN